ncbi:hypothetical protein SLEP1_g45977 [Rubroshorea leprosula]|uniref:Uncharacterized protein n=1 Tax=Rubroshorea leprosula TaxID=152421 RepID=A0AAV5LLH8_9ROSI|nr:hypothetical protein SLEP1_g45977 [Rubroshorea leprosula]
MLLWLQKVNPLSSAGENHRHRSERLSPEHNSRDLEPPPRLSKRKSDPQHDHERDRDPDYDDRERERDRHHHQRPESSSKPTIEMITKVSPSSANAADKKHKGSVFSRISFPEEDASKRRKPSSEPASSSAHHRASSNGYYDDHKSSSTAAAAAAKAVPAASGGVKKSSSSAVDYESSDDDRHFKRKPSRHEPSPLPLAGREEEPRHARGHRDRERSGYSKHR